MRRGIIRVEPLSTYFRELEGADFGRHSKQG
jgi:hypothetical protein